MASISTSTNNSSSVVLDNIDDYLAPSQACINPAFQPKQPQDGNGVANASANQNGVPSAGKVIPRRRRRVVRRPVLQADQEEHASNGDVANKPRNGVANGKSSKPPADPIKASIADCLACSGCVTTAETVLLEQNHSLNSLKQRLQDESKRHRAITLSPNSFADLCRHWKLEPTKHTFAKLATLLHMALQTNLVVDGNIPLEWTWQDEANEFVSAYRANKSKSNSVTKTPPPSTAVDSQHTLLYQPDGTTKVVNPATISTTPKMPLISGSCPALVCLIEKSHASLVPHLSRAVSPMSRLGWTLKKSLQSTWDHWAVMPCHDKKLEASRKDFCLQPKSGDQEVVAVDLVVTTFEMVQVLEEWKTKQQQQESCDDDMKSFLDSLSEAQIVCPDPTWTDTQVLSEATTMAGGSENGVVALTFMFQNGNSLVNDNSNDSVSKAMAMSSGGHANYIFRQAVHQLFGYQLVGPISWTSLVDTSSSKSIKSARLAKLQKKQQAYQACLYRNMVDGRLSQEMDDDDDSWEVVLRFGIANGMQTMQRALQDIESSTRLDYLEAMACPHGCVNGGGSVPTSTSSMRETPTETRHRVQASLAKLQVPTTTTSSTPSQECRTHFHVVPPMQHTMGATAGVKVQDMVW